MQFFPHPCLDHLHDEYFAWDPQRVALGSQVRGLCVQGISPPHLLLAAYSHAGCSVTLVAILNNLCLQDTLEEIFPDWVLL